MTDIIKAKIRKSAGKGECHRLRNKNKVPGILYGLGSPNVLVEFSELELFEVLHKKGEHGLIDIDLNGTNEKVMIKDVQHAPLTQRITHIDFQRINEESSIKMTVPIKLVGEKKYMNTNDVVQLQVDEIDVEGRADKIPNCFVVDISKLPPGGIFKAKEIKKPDEISILTSPETVIAVITKVKNKVEQTEPLQTSSFINSSDSAKAQ